MGGGHYWEGAFSTVTEEITQRWDNRSKSRNQKSCSTRPRHQGSPTPPPPTADPFCPAVPRMTDIHPSKLEVTLIDHFPVSFGVEGGTINLVCHMVVVPDLPNLPPLAHWYRDGKWV